MSTSYGQQGFETLRAGTLGGIAGGLAEVAWISAYGIVTGAPLAPVARGIVESTLPQFAASPWAPALGIVIHLGLAVALGIALAIAVRQVLRRWAEQSEFSVAIATLLLVWAVNFFLVLPYLNPGFVQLLPYGVTLVSKLFFGLSAAAVLRSSRLRPIGEAVDRRRYASR
jgi:hypothetical protein